ncbi:MAG TPA: polyprenyl diphosphate synthase [Candidatus Acidoferrales bacterium]|nr:polyprenyl diphosphate synthase [Candidatus Acidoferrales bacterium]
MVESTLYIVPPTGLHVAILMDGNGRWAEARGLSRSAGHRAGVEAVRRVVEAAPTLDIDTLTLFAFSANNWQRHPAEVGSLFGLLETYFFAQALRAAEHDVRVSVIGRRDRLPSALVSAIEAAETATARHCGLDLRIAVDYSAREAMLQAACWMMSSTEVNQQEFSRRIGQVTHAPDASPDVDLLIRTGGEQRLSDFLLWECAYAELHFTERMWPDFGVDDLQNAVREFRARDRRFGRAPVRMASAASH